MVERLKLYVEYTGLMAAQFAETINMPRSSFSQLMNGRNKTITDATIKKIHDAFPELSITWLLFGEGEMLISEANETTTEKQAQQELNFESENKKFTPKTTNVSKYEQDLEVKSEDSPTQNADLMPHVAEIVVNKVEKKIAKIMVFYDDNSFECFKPE